MTVRKKNAVKSNKEVMVKKNKKVMKAAVEGKVRMMRQAVHSSLEAANLIKI